MTVTCHHIKRTQGTSSKAPEEPPKPNAYWWYETIEAPDDIQPTLQSLIDGTALWVTDGSFKGAQGSTAFILLPNIEATTGIKLVNQTPGREQDIDAYQAEVGGIYGCIASTNKLLSEYNITQGQVNTTTTQAVL
jgi:hypothetical protein